MNLPCQKYSEISKDNVSILNELLPKIKEYLGLYSCENGEDSLLKMLSHSALSLFESFTRQGIYNREMKLELLGFSRFINIGKGRVNSIASVKYFDEDNVEQTIDPSNYEVNTYRYHTILTFKDDFDCPNVYDDINYPITILYNSGFAVAVTGALTDDICMGIVALSSYLYQNRDCACSSTNLPKNVRAIFQPYRIESI